MAPLLVTAAVIVTLVLFVLVYTPIIIFHLKVYYLNHKHPVYQLRYCNITIIQGILFVIKLLYDSFYTISPIYLFGHHSTANKIVSIINTYLAAYLIYSFVWKFWMLRYDIIINDIVINSDWKSIINPNLFAKSNANTTFYIKYRQQFGNPTYIMWISFTMATILTTIYVITILFLPDIYGQSTDNSYIISLFSSWHYIIPYILLLIIYYTSPLFNDNFHITMEMKLIFTCLSINYIAYFGHLLLFSTLHGSVSKTVEDIGILLVTNVILFAQFCALMISTKWVNDQCRRIIKNQRYSVTRVPAHLQLKQTQVVEIRGSPNKNIDDLYQLVLETLSTSKMYHSFINFLSAEMCIECMLSLTEFVQYRQYIKWYMEVRHFIGDIGNIFVAKERQVMMEDLFKVQLPEDIPNSWIVANNEWANKRKAYELYKKYVAVGSDHEINISSPQRKYFSKLFADYDAFAADVVIGEAQLMTLFDGCCDQMVQLMMDAMRRFQKQSFHD